MRKGLFVILLVFSLCCLVAHMDNTKDQTDEDTNRLEEEIESEWGETPKKKKGKNKRRAKSKRSLNKRRGAEVPPPQKEEEQPPIGQEPLDELHDEFPDVPFPSSDSSYYESSETPELREEELRQTTSQDGDKPQGEAIPEESSETDQKVHEVIQEPSIDEVEGENEQAQLGNQESDSHIGSENNLSNRKRISGSDENLIKEPIAEPTTKDDDLALKGKIIEESAYLNENKSSEEINHTEEQETQRPHIIDQVEISPKDDVVKEIPPQEEKQQIEEEKALHSNLDSEMNFPIKTTEDSKQAEEIIENQLNKKDTSTQDRKPKIETSKTEISKESFLTKFFSPDSKLLVYIDMCLLYVENAHKHLVRYVPYPYDLVVFLISGYILVKVFSTMFKTEKNIIGKAGKNDPSEKMLQIFNSKVSAALKQLQPELALSGPHEREASKERSREEKIIDRLTERLSETERELTRVNVAYAKDSAAHNDMLDRIIETEINIIQSFSQH